MKKLFKLLPFFFMAVLGSVMLSCSDDDDDPIPADELPVAAKTFLNTYYPSIKIVSTTKDKNEYDVVLANGHSVDFTKDGEWKDVEAPVGQTIPSGFYPAEIDTYIASSAGGAVINEIQKTARGYEVELVTGADLLFDSDGVFLQYDRD